MLALRKPIALLLLVALALLFISTWAISEFNPRNPLDWIPIILNEIRNLLNRQKSLADQIRDAKEDLKTAQAQEQAARNQRDDAYVAWQDAVGKLSKATEELNTIDANLAQLHIDRKAIADELATIISPSKRNIFEARLSSIDAQIQGLILQAIDKRWQIVALKTEVSRTQQHYIFTQLNHDMALRHLKEVERKLEGLNQDAEDLRDDLDDAQSSYNNLVSSSEQTG